MKVLVDTCGWIEWLTDGILADKFAPYLININDLIVPTSIQYELHKWICREKNEEFAKEIIALTQQGKVIPLSESLAILTSQVSRQFKLSFADAIIYATAVQEKVQIITSDDHFLNLPNVQYFSKKSDINN
ncbi:type II toxin-antitoxin system VapC family toxin [Geminocystis sp. CENA526]|uniref:type II toxin-antitoxin system VapC family toxin n=1 Tax=Geminocystis sp. CENA526 TaxID=1355871 RepID=UPI003D6E5209